ncbi:MAG: hypothetical protein IKX52_02240, partial [Clostridia bacterium]|nr:hypothetical protein [Clostridia bacterium]
SLKSTQSVLKDVNKLLKLDPSNTELLVQKQKALKSAIADTKDRLQQLKDAQSGVEKGSAEWDALQCEIIATEQNLKSLQKEYREFGSVASQQIKAAGKAMQDFGGKVSDAGKKFQPISTAAAGALTALGGLAYKAVEAADDINTLAQQTGFTTEEIQQMQYAADLVDVSFDDMAAALKKLKPKISEDNEALAALGVTVTNADETLRDANDAFFDAVEALSKIDNETERDQAAMELFGKSADELAGVIDDGGAALKEYGKQAKDLGLIMDGETLDALNDVNDTLDQLKANTKGSLAKLGSTLAKTLTPALNKVTKLIDKVTDKLSKLTPQQTETILKILGVVAAIAPVLTIGGKLIKMVGSLVSVIGTVVGVLGGPLTIAIAAVVAAGVLLWKNWDKVKEAAGKVKDTVVKAWNNIKTSVTKAANDVKTSVSNAWNNIKTATSTAWDGVKSVLQSKWNSIKSAYENAGGGLKGAASATMTAIKEYYKTGWDAINTLTGGKLNTIKDKVVGVFNTMKTAVSTAIENLKATVSSKFESLRSSISSIVDKIKSAFSFNWSMPRIKLPHVTVTYTDATWAIAKWFGIDKIPHLSISWYKKAYDNPVMFNSPTVLATPSGYKGFGDGHGAEIVLGLEKLRELVGSSGVVINVYASEGMDVNALADKIQDRFIAMKNQRRAAYA